LGEEFPKEIQEDEIVEDSDEIEKEKEEIDENSVEEINIDDKIPEIKEAHELEDIINKEPSAEEKTLGAILNINWEELKNAKAKVTITIDFGD
jgi:uncharacterized membrane protein